MAWIPIYVTILFLIIIVDYVAARKIEAASGGMRKLFLLVSVLANVSLLALFKYYDFFCENFTELLHLLHLTWKFPPLNLILPIGLSFHTFQALAYTIEVYNGKQRAETQLGIYALYVMFYPQLVAGPIERPQNLIHQFKEDHPFEAHNVVSGLRLMLWGFFKKMVIADRLGILVNHVYNQPHEYSGIPLLLATYCFAYQVYCDFSGYSDIAIGAARVMGFGLIRNFNSPFAATTIQDFWNRWHISLSSFFRDFVYVPIALTFRAVPGRNALAALITMALAGLWHGANWTYVIYGLLHGFYLVVYIYWRQLSLRLAKHVDRRLHQLFGLLFTFNAFCFSCIFFRGNSVTDAVWIVEHLFPLNNADKVGDLGLTGGEILMTIVAIMILEFVQYMERNKGGVAYLEKQKLTTRWICYYTLFFYILVLGEFGGARFIYFQF